MIETKLKETYTEVLSINYSHLWEFLKEGKSAICILETEEPFFAEKKQKFERVAILGITPEGYCRFGTPGMGYGPIKFEDYPDFEKYMIHYNVAWVKP